MVTRTKEEQVIIYWADDVWKKLNNGQDVHIPGKMFRGGFEIKIRGDKARMILRRVFGRKWKDDV